MGDPVMFRAIGSANGAARRHANHGARGSNVIVRLIVALAALAAVFVLPMIQDAHADKEFMVIGSVDCGRASGQRCTVGSTITVWTTDVTGLPDQGHHRRLLGHQSA